MKHLSPDVISKAIEASNDGVLITDPKQPDNPIVYANPAITRITGFSSDDLLGNNCRILQRDDRDQTEIQQIREAVESKQAVRVVLKNYKKDGTPFWNELSITPVFTESGDLDFYVGIQKDVTQHVENEQAMKILNHQLKEMNEVMTGRELKMIELKKEIEALKKDQN